MIDYGRQLRNPPYHNCSTYRDESNRAQGLEKNNTVYIYPNISKWDEIDYEYTIKDWGINTDVKLINVEKNYREHYLKVTVSVDDETYLIDAHGDSMSLYQVHSDDVHEPIPILISKHKEVFNRISKFLLDDGIVNKQNLSYGLIGLGIAIKVFCNNLI